MVDLVKENTLRFFLLFFIPQKLYFFKKYGVIILYGDRQNVMSIHTIMHINESIKNFGGLYNYSTFNFEGYLGSFNLL